MDKQEDRDRSRSLLQVVVVLRCCLVAYIDDSFALRVPMTTGRRLQ